MSNDPTPISPQPAPGKQQSRPIGGWGCLLVFLGACLFLYGLGVAMHLLMGSSQP